MSKKFKYPEEVLDDPELDSFVYEGGKDIEQPLGDVDYVEQTVVSAESKTFSRAEELAIAKQLDGQPHKFDLASVKLLQALQAKGVAAYFGSEGWGRGFAWKNFMRG